MSGMGLVPDQPKRGGYSRIRIGNIKNMFSYPGYDDHDAGGLTARGLLLARPGPEA